MTKRAWLYTSPTHFSRMSVLLFRTPKFPNDSYDQALKQAGNAPHFIPALHFQFINQEGLSKALLNSSQYSGIIFTSQTAVESASSALSRSAGETSSAGATPLSWTERLAEEWRYVPVFVVGKATALAVSELGLKPFGSCSGNAEALSQIIIEYFSSREQDRPLLFPCSNLKRETIPSSLRQAGVNLELLVCYTTEPHPDIQGNISSFVEELVPGEVVYVVFFSPSGVEYALDKLMTISDKRISFKFVAIGPTSAEALCKVGYPPTATAVKPTPDSLVSALSHI